MKYDSLLIHFGELSTKGDNRKTFISKLHENLKHAIKPFPSASVFSCRDYIEISLHDEDPEAVLSRVREVSGIQRIGLVLRVEKDIEAIKKASLELISLEKGRSFKLATKRSDKSYPMNSYEVSVAVADYILDNTSLEVDVHNPDITLKVEIKKGAAFLCAHEYPGAGGYPLGMNGKVLMLLSGGIDSPVAAYELLRRGIKVECIHFAAPPYTSMAVLDKLDDLLAILNNYQPDIRLNVVPFTELQLAIYDHVDEPYCITIMRRMMMRIATGLAKRRKCLAIATGESIGQVASQTLESMGVINEVTNFPIIRPLATSDKLSIISTAQRIGTFDISIRPYEDCCTIFKPKKPKTKPRLDECLFFESKWDWKPMVEKCIDEIEVSFMVDGIKKVHEDVK